jgi:hypothetical protein
LDAQQSTLSPPPLTPLVPKNWKIFYLLLFYLLIVKLDLNSICKYIFDKTFDNDQPIFTRINTDFSLDVSIVLLSMIRALMNQQSQQNVDILLDLIDDKAVGNLNIKDYPIILLQIFRFMYHNCDDFHGIASNAELLAALVMTVYPYYDLSESQTTTPLIEFKPFGGESLVDSKANSCLSTHAARKLVMEFVRDLIFDGLSSANIQTKSLTIVDSIILSLPDVNNAKRNQELLTEIFKCIIDCLQTTDILNETSGTNPHTVIANLSGIVDRLIDKLWDGMY